MEHNKIKDNFKMLSLIRNTIVLSLIFFSFNTLSNEQSSLCDKCSDSQMKRKAINLSGSTFGKSSINLIDLSNKKVINYQVLKVRDPEFGSFTYAIKGNVSPETEAGSKNLFDVVDGIKDLVNTPIEYNELAPYIERGKVIDSAHKLSGSDYNKALLGKALSLYLDEIHGDSTQGVVTFLGQNLLNSVINVMEGSSFTIVFNDGSKYDYKLKGLHFNISSKTVIFEFEAIRYSGKDGDVTIPEGSWNGFGIIGDAPTINRFKESAYFSGMIITGTAIGRQSWGMECNKVGGIEKCIIFPMQE